MAIPEPTIFGRFDAAAFRRRLDEAGVFARLRERGFDDFEVAIDARGLSLPRVRLFGVRQGARVQLIEACLGETIVRPEFFAGRGWKIDSPLELALVWWLREEDPTRPFAADRPALPLQDHPGLGCLRRAFRAMVSLAAELGKDGIASVPKFFHDAVLFQRSRLFLFLDAAEQGRFEALRRALSGLPLGEATLALVGGAVRDRRGNRVDWQPGLLVFPMSERAAAWFHSREYAEAAGAAEAAARFTLARSEPPALAAS